MHDLIHENLFHFCFLEMNLQNLICVAQLVHSALHKLSAYSFHESFCVFIFTGKPLRLLEVWCASAA